MPGCLWPHGPAVHLGTDPSDAALLARRLHGSSHPLREGARRGITPRPPIFFPVAIDASRDGTQIRRHMISKGGSCMTEHTLTSLDEAAGHLLDTLASGAAVTLEVSAQDATTGALLRLITAIHDLARTRRLGVVITATGAHQIRLEL